MLYRNGYRELSRQAYLELHRAKLIQHWQDRANLTLDLHGFNRGLAYAAVWCAIHEVRLGGRADADAALS